MCPSPLRCGTPSSGFATYGSTCDTCTCGKRTTCSSGRDHHRPWVGFRDHGPMCTQSSGNPFVSPRALNRLKRRLQGNKAVFVPACPHEGGDWCLYVFITNHSDLRSGTVYVVDSCRSRRNSLHHAVIENILHRLGSQWFFVPLPCARVAQNFTCLSMLHHLHTLLHARFWVHCGDTSWTVGHPPFRVSGRFHRKTTTPPCPPRHRGRNPARASSPA